MKIAILVGNSLRKTLINEKTLAQLQALGEVVLCEGDEITIDAAKQLLQGADVAVTSWGSPRMEAELLDCCPQLKLVCHAAGSVKGIVSDELYRRGVRVISSARVLSEGVSDTALGLTIAACKNFFAFNTQMHQGGWVADYSVVTEMFGITVGVVGCGFAGAKYAKLLQAFDLDVLVYDPLKTAEEIAQLGARKAELDELFANSDVVSLHAPELESTRHIVNEQRLGLMKKGSILINTARASLIDTEALKNALRSGTLKYACLDVYDKEPLDDADELRTIPNCILTPHIAGAANNGKQKIGAHVLQEIQRMLNGEALISEITQEMLSTIA